MHFHSFVHIPINLYFVEIIELDLKLLFLIVCIFLYYHILLLLLHNLNARNIFLSIDLCYTKLNNSSY